MLESSGFVTHYVAHWSTGLSLTDEFFQPAHCKALTSSPALKILGPQPWPACVGGRGRKLALQPLASHIWEESFWLNCVGEGRGGREGHLVKMKLAETSLAHYICMRII